MKRKKIKDGKETNRNRTLKGAIYMNSLQGIQSVVNVLQRRTSNISIQPQQDGSTLIIAIEPSPRVRGENITIVLKLDQQERVIYSDLYSERNGKFLIAPTRTYYPSMERIKLPVDTAKCIAGQPYWVNYK